MRTGERSKTVHLCMIRSLSNRLQTRKRWLLKSQAANLLRCLHAQMSLPVATLTQLVKINQLLDKSKVKNQLKRRRQSKYPNSIKQSNHPCLRSQTRPRQLLLINSLRVHRLLLLLAISIHSRILPKRPYKEDN